MFDVDTSLTIIAICSMVVAAVHLLGVVRR